MNKLPKSKNSLNSKEEVETWKYCAPIFIASTFSGTLLYDDKDLAPEEFDNSKSIRSGTLTFISYKGETFAVTCKHVVDELENRQEAWKKEQINKYGFEPPIEGFHLFTPVGNNQYHFNYKLFPASKIDHVIQPDIAIARIKLSSIKRLNKSPIVLATKHDIPETGIASGYPEQQRRIMQGKHTNKFIQKFVSCTASLQITAKGDILLQDSIEKHNDLDSLSGMSGGPILWLDSNKFGLAGIVREGLDVQPKEGQLMAGDGIWIHGERITPKIFEQWIEKLPEVLELKDETKSLYVPEGMKD